MRLRSTVKTFFIGSSMVRFYYLTYDAELQEKVHVNLNIISRL